MSLGERISNVAELRAWTDQIPLRYEYTAGVGGEKFLRGLQAGKILASVCEKCGRKYVPAKVYCTEDFHEIEKFEAVGGSGQVAATAESHVDFNGEELKKSRLFVFVQFPGAVGGMIHYGLGRLAIGDRVVAKFKPSSERTGTMLDVEGFQKA